MLSPQFLNILRTFFHNLSVLGPDKSLSTHNLLYRYNPTKHLKLFIKQIIYKIIYQNDISSETKFYFGLTDTPFKERFENHTRDFKHRTYSKNHEISKYIWDLKETGINLIVKWSIVEKIYCNTKINYCKLYLLEKLYIIDFIDDNRLLNKRNEFIRGCKHQNKLLLKNVK